MEQEKSPHILNASSNLVGFCFVVITSIKVFGKESATIVDNVALITLLFFLVSTLFSYLSIHTSKTSGSTYEKIAGTAFLSGIALLTVSFTLLVLDIIR